jgi:hypothetical protein
LAVFRNESKGIAIFLKNNMENVSLKANETLDNIEII